MASNRHLGRIIALQTLYENDFRTGSQDASFDLPSALARNMHRYADTVDDAPFVQRLVDGVVANSTDLLERLTPANRCCW